MKTIQGKEFEADRVGNSTVINDIYFEKCSFNGISISHPATLVPREQTIIKNCEFRNCKVYETCDLSKGTITHCIFENLKTSGTVIASGILFDKTIFRGKIGSVLLSSGYKRLFIPNEYDQPVRVTEDEKKPIFSYKETFYNSIDWALDISEAIFKSCDLRSNIPAHLIKRDSETQALIKYENITKGKWKKIKALKDYDVVDITFSIADDDCILVAPKGDKERFVEYMEAIKILREEGIAEPN